MTSSLAPQMKIGSIAAQAFDSDEPPTFREVMAYLDGVAAAMTANRQMPPPVSLVPCTTPPASWPTRCAVGETVSMPAGDDSSCARPSGVHAAGTGAHLTLRHGEPSAAVDRILSGVEGLGATRGDGDGAARGGARLLDLGAAENVAHVDVRFRNTLPYGIESVSVAPRGTPVTLPRTPAELTGTPAELARSLAILDAALEKEGDRTSDVYLRCARLSAEWYDLTGTGEK